MKSTVRSKALALVGVVMLSSSTLLAETGAFMIRGKVTNVDTKEHRITVSDTAHAKTYEVSLPENPRMKVLAGKGSFLSSPTINQLSAGDYVSLEVRPATAVVAMTK